MQHSKKTEYCKKRSSNIRKYAPLLLIIAAFVIIKIPHLFLPHYWDESWSYATAVQLMYENGPTLLPGIINVEATRGHPLFFYAASASWMKLFGATLFSKHSFALFISLILLITVYEVCRKLYNTRIAIVATILFSSQIFFFVQSSMLLPEVMVTLFIFLSIYFYVTQKFILLSITLSLLYLTKESGLVLGIILGSTFFTSLFNTALTREYKIKICLALLIPALIIVAFFFYQKTIYGWFFFPEHIGLIDLDLKDFSLKFQSTLFVVFIEGYRKWLWMIICAIGTLYSIKNNKYNWFVWIIIIALVFIFRYVPFSFFKSSIITIIFIIYVLVIAIIYSYRTICKSQSKQFIVINIMFSIAYLIFCSVNFYTTRYLMPALLISLILFAVWIDISFRKMGLMLYAAFSGVLILITIQSYLKNNDIGDTGLGSYNSIRTQQEIINFLERNNAQNVSIGIGSFQQRINMQNLACGFIHKKSNEFNNVRWEIDSLTEYAVFDNIEPDSRFDVINKDPDFKLLYKVEHDNVWGCIYKRIEKE